MARSLLVAMVGGALARPPFCPTGIYDTSAPELLPDSDDVQLEVIVAQAAMGSVNPKVGQFLGKFFWAYHTAIIFRTKSASEEPQYWTLEYDSPADKSLPNGLLPSINGSQMTFLDNASFCFMKGIENNRSHWLKTWEPVMTLTARQARATLQELIRLDLWTGPYQMFGVEGRWTGLFKPGQRYFDDTKCDNGVRWFLYYASTLFSIPLRKDFRFHGTRVLFNAREVVAVNSTNTEDWKIVVKSYERVVKAFTDPLWKKPFAAARVFPVRGLYDANSKTYFKVIGNRFPFVRFEFPEQQICSPPWVKSPACLRYLPDPGMQQLVMV